MSFDELVDRWITERYSECPDFGALVRALPGVYPAEVLRALHRLGLAVRLPPSELLQVPEGPTPHPADADWRFDQTTSTALAEEVAEACGDEGRAALLGCPSLFLPLQRHGVRVALLEENDAWRKWFRRRGAGSRMVGAFDRLPEAEADVLVADPPWYLTEYGHFLSLAARLAKPNATLLIAWPPEGTRPGLGEEWREVSQLAVRCGWLPIGVRPRALGYTTPWYEAQALTASGVPVLNGWRRGDAVTFRRTVGEAPDQLPPAPRAWTAARFGFVDLRLRLDAVAKATADPRLIPMVTGDVLASVSRRDPIRERVRVWTAGNRVYECARPDLLGEIAAAHRGGVRRAKARVERKLNRRLTSVEWSWCAEAWDQLVTLEKAERRDYAAAHGAIADPSTGAAARSHGHPRR